MVKVIQQNNKELYQCVECGFHYGEREWVKKCEAWCREHKSCNIEITAHAEENKQNKVLFVCAENAGRSQMAEAFFNFYTKGSNWKGESSGTIPVQEINPAVIEVMQEKGIDIRSNYPKKFNPADIGAIRKGYFFWLFGKRGIFSKRPIKNRRLAYK